MKLRPKCFFSYESPSDRLGAYEPSGDYKPTVPQLQAQSQKPTEEITEENGGAY